MNPLRKSPEEKEESYIEKQENYTKRLENDLAAIEEDKIELIEGKLVKRKDKRSIGCSITRSKSKN